MLVWVHGIAIGLVVLGGGIGWWCWVVVLVWWCWVVVLGFSCLIGIAVVFMDAGVGHMMLVWG
jgi:hypothetical protein